MLKLLFLSNLLITFSSTATGNLIPSQFNNFACSFNCSVILSECFTIGFNALVTHHLKHSSSSFFMLIIAFLAANSFGNGMYDLPFNGLYVPVLISSLMTDFSLQLLPFI